jgi:O-antigen/teichoic acid export membrane protein
MSRTRQILGATYVGYAQQIATVAVGLWLTPFLLGHVGQRDLGLWLVAGQLLGYLALVDLGILAILPREVAYASAREDATTQIAGLVAHVRRIVNWQVVALAALCLVILLFLPAQWSGLRWPLALVFLVFVAAYPLRIPSAVLQGLQDLPYLAKAQFVGWAAGTSVTVALVLAGSHLTALVGGWSVTLLLPAFAAMTRLRQSVNGRPQAGDLSASSGTLPLNGYVSRSMWVSAGQIGQVFLNGSDVLVISRILGAAAVVPYACTAKLVTIFANYPQMLVHSAQPALTALRGSGSRERLASVAQVLTQGMLIMSGALVTLVISTNRFFVTWWVGGTQYAGLPLTLAVSGMMLLRHWNVATNYTLFCFGYERQLSLVAFADGVVTIVGTALLVPRIGLVGAPIASMVGAALVGLPLNIRASAREIGLTVAQFLKPCLPLVIAMASVVGSTVFCTVWLDTSRFLTAAGITAGALSLYAAAMSPFVLSGPLKPYAITAISMLPVFSRRGQPTPIPTGAI